MPEKIYDRQKGQNGKQSRSEDDNDDDGEDDGEDDGIFATFDKSRSSKNAKEVSGAELH